MVQTFLTEGDLGPTSNITAGAEKNKEAVLSGRDTTDISITVKGGDSDVNEATWASPQLNDANWPLGDYQGEVDVIALGGNSSYKVQLSRYQSGDVRDQILGTSASQTATGVFNFTQNIDPSAGATGDRLVMEILSSRSASHGNETTIFRNSVDADSFIQVPFDAGGTTPVTKVITGRFDIAEFVTKLITGRYDIIEFVTKAITGRYNILQFATKIITGRYDILLFVNKVITGRFDIVQFVTKTFTGRYDLAGKVTKIITGRYDIAEFITKTITGRYDILLFATKVITGRFDIATFVTKLVTGRYDIAQFVTKTITGRYDIFVFVTKAITGRFDIAEFVNKMITGRYDIAIFAKKVITGRYDILGAGAAVKKLTRRFRDLMRFVPQENSM